MWSGLFRAGALSKGDPDAVRLIAMGPARDDGGYVISPPDLYEWPGATEAFGLI